MTTVRGTVINIHHHGATVRLEDGSLATIALLELVANRPAYTASLAKRHPLEFTLDRQGRHRVAALIVETSSQGSLSQPVAASPQAEGANAQRTISAAAFADIAFEAQIGAYLKATQEWAPPDQAPPAERHFIRKKRRARLFEARGETT